MPLRSALAFLALCLASTTLSGEDPAPGKQVEQKLNVGDGQSIAYLLYLPKDYDASAEYPLMLFLHGRGESYGPLSIMQKWGPPRIVAEGKHLPYIIAAPQCPKDTSWNRPGEQEKLAQLLEHLDKTYSIDDGRMYLTGLSMGGFGCWALAAKHPDKFAAVVPICGRGDPSTAERLKGTPIWVWHGLEDKIVPPSASGKMVKAIQELKSENDELKGELEDMVADGNNAMWSFFDREAAQQRLRAHLAGQADLHAGLWRLLFFYRWAHQHLGVSR